MKLLGVELTPPSNKDLIEFAIALIIVGVVLLELCKLGLDNVTATLFLLGGFSGFVIASFGFNFRKYPLQSLFLMAVMNIVALLIVKFV